MLKNKLLLLSPIIALAVIFIFSPNINSIGPTSTEKFAYCYCE